MTGGRNQTTRTSPLRALGILGTAAILFVVGCTSSTSNQTAGSAPPGTSATTPTTTAKPNILFVLTDDMRLDDLAFMPNVKKVLTDQGMSFENEFDNVTLCCPARTAILRGQYSHNSGVLTNGGANGGFETAYKLGVEKQTVATALHDAGYTTGLFGKYLNGYPRSATTDYVPPGWDAWSSSVKGNAYGEFDYTLNQNGKEVAYGKKPEDYGTDVYVRQAKDFVTQAGKDGKPFFGYIGVYAPHSPATPAPRHDGLFADSKAPRDPAFNEADVSDKPKYIQDQAVLPDAEVKKIDDLYRQRARSLQAVDEGVAGLVDTLERTGQLPNTYIAFTSDNGFHLGQHRLPAGKQTAYETDIHLPLIIRGPNIVAGSKTSAITGNVDLAPTFAALGGAVLTDNPDGRSLVPWLRGEQPADWRQVFLLEHWTEKSVADPPPGDGPQLEPADPDQEAATGAAFGVPEQRRAGTTSTVPTTAESAPPSKGGKPRTSQASKTTIPEFQGLRADGYTYVEYITGEKEFYDLSKDPDELNNLIATADAALVTTFHQRLDDLRKCQAENCRSAEAKSLR